MQIFDISEMETKTSVPWSIMECVDGNKETDEQEK